jgi:hypothetical protein
MVRKYTSDLQGWGPYGSRSYINEWEISSQNGNGIKELLLVLVVVVVLVI